ncbi:MAG: DUF3563 family protein [Rhodoferax sp.]|nr:DUF3563 family protein [Rhodoferax sp.]
MSHLIELIKAIVPHIPTQQERDEAYLSESVDMVDVERRIWEIDHRDSQSQQTPAMGGALH